MSDEKNTQEDEGGVFSNPFSDEERAQLKQMAKFLVIVLVFVMLASLSVGFIVMQLG